MCTGKESRELFVAVMCGSVAQIVMGLQSKHGEEVRFPWRSSNILRRKKGKKASSILMG
jgi:hypothetical protein